MRRLNRPQFQDALKKGLGRAVAHVRAHGAADLREEIVYACAHDLVYDKQLEDDRLDYLLRIISLSGEEGFYQAAICRALAESRDTWNALQLAALAGAFARRGNTEARRAIYETFKRMELDELVGDQEIMLVDGLDGFLWMVEHYGARLAEDHESKRKVYYREVLAWRACELFGEHEVLRALSERAGTVANARAYLDALKRSWLKEEQEDSTEHKVPSVDEVLRNVEDDKDVNWRFARRASDSEIDEVFDHLLAETRPKQLGRLLSIFAKREAPRLDGRLFELAEHEDTFVRRMAMRALGKSDDLWVRQFALSLLKRRPESAGEGAVDLLFLTYQPADHEVIEKVLPAVHGDWDRHGLGLDILILAEEYHDPHLVPSLLWVYQNGPCTNCRDRVVECLVDLRAAPWELLQECLDDCYGDIRERAEKAICDMDGHG